MKLKCTKIAISLYPILLLILLFSPIMRSVAVLPGHTGAGESINITNVYWLQPIRYANIVCVILFFCGLGGYIAYFIIDTFTEKNENSLGIYFIFLLIISCLFLLCLFTAIAGGPNY